MGLTAGDVMQTDVRSLHPKARLADLDQWLLQGRVGGAPVIEDGRLLGIVSRTDVLRQLVIERTQAQSMSASFEEEEEGSTAEGADAVGQTVAARWARLCVADVMIHDVIRVPPDEPLEAVDRTLVQHRIHRVLVTEGERLLGIVSSLDLVRLVAEGKAAG